MSKEVIMMIVWAVIAVAAYFVGFFIGRHEGINKFFDGVIGVSVKTDWLDNDLDNDQDNNQDSKQDNKSNKKIHKLKVKIKK